MTIGFVVIDLENLDILYDESVVDNLGEEEIVLR
jgi:hypothetical protein